MFNEIRFSSDIRSNQWMDEGVTMSGDWLPYEFILPGLFGITCNNPWETYQRTSIYIYI